MTPFMKIKKIITLSLILLIALTSRAQTPTCYRIYLSDKDNSPYSINNPIEYLSQRAIDKRARFNIPITEQDFPVNPNYIGQIKQIDYKIQILTTSKWMNSVTIYCPDNEKLSIIEALDFVDSLIPVAAYRLNSNNNSKKIAKIDSDSRNDSDFLSDSLGFYGLGKAQIAIHNGDKLHEAGFRGEGMLIVVIDGGFFGVESCDFYKKLIEEGRFLGMYDLMPNFDTSYYPSPYTQAHGTAVASVIAANKENIFVGTAPEASYVFIQSEYSPSEELIEEDFWARAAEIADSIGADVVNSSLGYTLYPDFPQANTDYSTFDGLHSIASLSATILANKGVIPCIAVGNDGLNDWFHIGKPSDAFDVISVGACTYDSIIAGFSSRGYTFDGRVKPDVVSVGFSTTCYRPGNSIIQANGTSFATPVIAGLCACLWQALPQYSSIELMQKIREYSSQYLTPDIEFGYGIPDFYYAYFDLLSIPNHSFNSANIFPNPCKDYFVIEDENSEKSVIKLYNIQGKNILTTTKEYGNKTQINIQNLPNGLYIGEILTKSYPKKYFRIIKR